MISHSDAFLEAVVTSLTAKTQCKIGLSNRTCKQTFKAIMQRWEDNEMGGCSKKSKIFHRKKL
jgi:hypothetical protein